ncbi:MAG: ABC transporter ATP-binding protein [Halomonas sp.]|jgi:spermidine/putrescine transport system ATP-binding protein|uniref:ABC transporter ATP-binding protein n=1 Tax=Billgrantia tianxiuensis TaxID=2497861 RepID=A0A6I6SPG0_9GAMM|nr:MULTISPECIES: ABC transporter ATP-binding protein [Halomonas]MCE8032820.1 ABC transporter ATP-binding protein [Halomonas sp. MCCC 1A11057]MDX5432139.1 ABC transporter ATP-binding protein [Halomonas sp.]MDX5502013.1 ABC transporter ATP-binding protein [Halomonas sp.]QHC49295.1 ABC transporter ATP-binding protein [Halomonas tianxiuensis]
MDGSVRLDEVVMRFGDFTAIEKTSLSIGSGEFFSFLGPSGCGKTTLLNIVSGFITPSEGQVYIGGEPMAGVPVNRRPTAMIFQNLALFPLMTVFENIEFGLEVRGVDKRKRREVSERLLALVALEGSGPKMVTELSGGQKQRVAIARALAVEPRVLLLDEPLSALDLKLRQHMRTELKAIQRKTGITFIYITHDQGEALNMSDRVAVMSAGRIQQVADPMTLYREPATGFVASFVGENNRLQTRVIDREGERVRLDGGALGELAGRTGSEARLANGEAATLFVRPEHLRPVAADATGARLEAEIEAVHFEGAWVMLEARLIASGEKLRVQLGHEVSRGQANAIAVGQRMHFGFDPADAVVLPDDGSPMVDEETGEVVVDSQAQSGGMHV